MGDGLVDQVVVISVPYTGTNFVVDMFRRAGYAEYPLNVEKHGRAVYQGHMTSPNQVRHALALGRTRPTVIPFRHPYRACETARRRGASVPAVLAAYRTMIAEFLISGPLGIAVDSPMRQAQLDALREIWPGLTTDWQPVGAQSGTAAMPLDAFRPSDDERVLAEMMRPLLAELYGDDCV